MKYLFLFWLNTCAVLTHAQNPVKKTPPAEQKTELRTVWGNLRSNEAPASFLRSLIDSSLHVNDNKSNQYEIDSFEFTYRQKDEFTNDETGKKEAHFYTVQYKASGARLPELWRKIVREKLKKDETLWFEKVIVRGRDGKLHLAPSLEIRVQ